MWFFYCVGGIEMWVFYCVGGIEMWVLLCRWYMSVGFIYIVLYFGRFNAHVCSCVYACMHVCMYICMYVCSLLYIYGAV